ncbi:MAG: hypothetical protein ACI82A_002982 [Candidatus Azotimanducaceae bacterium]|jgi:hypothetical protein
MKILLCSIALIATAALADETTDQIREAEHPDRTISRPEQVVEGTRVVVITEAEFVPFYQYLGLTDINTLAPSSAGNPRLAPDQKP